MYPNQNLFSLSIENALFEIYQYKVLLDTKRNGYVNQTKCHEIGHLALKIISNVGIVISFAAIPLAFIFSAELLFIIPITFLAYTISNICLTLIFGKGDYNHHIKELKRSMYSNNLPSGQRCLRQIKIIERDLKEQVKFLNREFPSKNYFIPDSLELNFKIISLVGYIYKSINEAIIDKNDESYHSLVEAQKIKDRIKSEANFSYLDPLFVKMRNTKWTKRAIKILNDQSNLKAIEVIDQISQM